MVESTESEPEVEVVPDRNHGKIDIRRLPAETRMNILALMHSIQNASGILKMQVTFDFKADQPPTVHIITEPTREAIDQWLS